MANIKVGRIGQEIRVVEMREMSTSQPMGSDMFSRSFSTRYRPAPEQTEPTRHDVEHSTRSPPQCPRAGSGVPAYEFGVKSVVSLIVWRVATCQGLWGRPGEVSTQRMR